MNLGMQALREYFLKNQELNIVVVLFSAPDA